MSGRSLFLGFVFPLLGLACANGDVRNGSLTDDPQAANATSSSSGSTAEPADDTAEQPCQEDGHAVAHGKLDGKFFGTELAPIAGKASYDSSYLPNAMAHFVALDTPEACWADGTMRKTYLAFDIPVQQAQVGKSFSGVPVSLRSPGISTERSTTCSRVEIVSGTTDTMTVRLRVQDTHGAVVEGELDYPVCTTQ